MDKRTEELQALANFLLAVGIIGIVICIVAPNEPVGYIGIVMLAIGLIGAISFDSLAQISFNEHVMVEENKLKYLSEQMDYLREVSYTFKAYVADNGCTMQEFVQMYDKLGWELDEVYEHYQYCAGDETIQTKQQVQSIINQERRLTDETA